MDVTLTTPRIGVHVFGYDGTEYDIHNDVVAVSVHKDLSSPAGRWALQLTSKRDAYGRTWAKRIRPADYVELHGSRTAPPGAQNSLTGDTSGQSILMRGFVDNAAEDIAVSVDGQVQRQVVINGRDYGKVLQKRQLVYASEINPLALSPELQPYLISSRLRMPDTDFLMSVSQFLGRIKEILVVDPTIGAQQNSARVPKLQARSDIPDTDKLFLVTLRPETGSIWNLLKSFEGAPWNELFLRDDDDAPRLYWRLSPVHNKTGRPQWPSSHDEVVSVPVADVISEKVQTSDNGPDGNGAYCAWLTVPTFMSVMNSPLNSEALYITLTGTLTNDLSLEAQLDPLHVRTGSAFVARTENPILRTDIFKRYGFAFHKALYPLFPIDFDKARSSGDAASKSDFGKTAARYTYWLHNTESWDPAMEKGTIVIKGNAHVRVGQHMQIVATDLKREFYVTAVDHQFSIFPRPDWTTTVTVDRGLWLSGNPYPELLWL